MNAPIRNAAVYRYSLPMEAGVVLRNQRLKTRDGLLIHLQQGGQEGWGEIAPLPEFSQETLAQAEQAALRWVQDWQGGILPSDSPLPSVAFGTSCALAELEQRLPLQADYRKAPLCTGDPDELFAVLTALPGEKVAKVKVGLYEAVRDGMIVNVLLEALPDLRLRLDATAVGLVPRRTGSLNTWHQRCVNALLSLKSLAKPVMNRGISRWRPALLSPGTKACARWTLWYRLNRAWQRSSLNQL